MMHTVVVNMATGETRSYSLAPEAAVRAAWLQERGDFNTWDYPKRTVPVHRGRLSVSAGNWAALTDRRK